jgi:hypothetical protein
MWLRRRLDEWSVRSSGGALGDPHAGLSMLAHAHRGGRRCPAQSGRRAPCGARPSAPGRGHSGRPCRAGAPLAPQPGTGSPNTPASHCSGTSAGGLPSVAPLVTSVSAGTVRDRSAALRERKSVRIRLYSADNQATSEGAGGGTRTRHAHHDGQRFWLSRLFPGLFGRSEGRLRASLASVTELKSCRGWRARRCRM